MSAQQKEIEELKKQLLQAEMLKVQNAEIKKMLTNSAQESAKETRKFRELEAELKSMREANQLLNQRLELFQPLEQHADLIKQADFIGKIHQLALNPDFQIQRQNELGGYQQRISQLTDQLSDVQQQLTLANAKISADKNLQQINEDGENQLKLIKNHSKEELEQILVKQLISYSQVTQQHQSQQQELQTATTQAAEYKQQVSDMTSRLEQLQNVMSLNQQLIQRVAELEHQLDQEAKAEQENEEIRILRAKLSYVMKKLLDHEQKEIAVQPGVEELRNTVAAHRLQIQKLQTANEQLTTKLQAETQRTQSPKRFEIQLQQMPISPAFRNLLSSARRENRDQFDELFAARERCKHLEAMNNKQKYELAETEQELQWLTLALEQCLQRFDKDCQLTVQNGVSFQGLWRYLREVKPETGVQQEAVVAMRRFKEVAGL